MDTQIIMLDNSKIRYVEDKDIKWFVTKDICKILNLSNVTNAVKNIEKNFKKYHIIKTNGGCQNMNTIILDGVKNLLQNCRSINKDKIISILNIDLNTIYDCKESSYLRIISTSFKTFSQIFQYKIGKYRIDLYFPDHNLAIEVDEFAHKDRCFIYEKERQYYLEKQLGCTFIRFNPDEKNFNIGNIISQILDETLLNIKALKIKPDAEKDFNL
jgi:very-short-patch-repair endonuclease